MIRVAVKADLARRILIFGLLVSLSLGGASRTRAESGRLTVSSQSGVENASDGSVAPPSSDPLWPTLVALVIIVAAGVTIIWLARRRPSPRPADLNPGGPKVVLGVPKRPLSQGQKLKGELKQREDSLEKFVGAGTGRLKRKVVDIATDDRPAGRFSRHGGVRGDE